jgi:hypothetical protein
VNAPLLLCPTGDQRPVGRVAGGRHRSLPPWAFGVSALRTWPRAAIVPLRLVGMFFAYEALEAVTAHQPIVSESSVFTLCSTLYARHCVTEAQGACGD